MLPKASTATSPSSAAPTTGVFAPAEVAAVAKAETTAVAFMLSGSLSTLLSTSPRTVTASSATAFPKGNFLSESLSVFRSARLRSSRVVMFPFLWHALVFTASTMPTTLFPSYSWSNTRGEVFQEPRPLHFDLGNLAFGLRLVHEQAV